MARVAVVALIQTDDVDFSILIAYDFRNPASSSVTHLGCSCCVTASCPTAPAWLLDQSDMQSTTLCLDTWDGNFTGSRKSCMPGDA
jgi:hypothetical protein